MEAVKNKSQEKEHATLVRILGRDISGDHRLISGLNKVKGISWGFANAVCGSLRMDRQKRIKDVTEEDIGKIESFVKDPKLPGFMKNRQKDFEDGEDKHVVGPDLRLRKDFDVKRMRKIKSYKGTRHANNLPVRGQRTKGNFRKNRKKSGATGAKSK
jgi:small subunit ribosomal protein S13